MREWQDGSKPPPLLLYPLGGTMSCVPVGTSNSYQNIELEPSDNIEEVEEMGDEGIARAILMFHENQAIDSDDDDEATDDDDV